MVKPEPSTLVLILLTSPGNFSYECDTQETDIEYLADLASLANNGRGRPVPMRYTNQPTQPENADKTTANGPASAKCTSTLQEYRVNWTDKYAVLHLDGVCQKIFKSNVPSQFGR
jgi:hypothetical protein